ncbi:MAG: hypothetical protein NVSMB16_01510 [Acidimicrobiales bacterium]
MQIEIAGRFAGPPAMGHGGYVSGLLAERTEGGVQVTLRRPIPLDVPLDLEEVAPQHFVLRRGDELLVESEPARLDLAVPPAPGLAQAADAAPASPSSWDGGGVHPVCFGCGANRLDGDGLRIFAGPVGRVGGLLQVAAVWRPPDDFADRRGQIGRRWVVAALDCPGAFAYLTEGVRAGLLGRIVFEQLGPVIAGEYYVVTGWRVADEGTKMIAGTALIDSSGGVVAAARAVWFPMAAAAGELTG